MKKIHFLLTLLVILIFAGLTWLGIVSRINFGKQAGLAQKEILVGGQKLSVEIAVTPEELAKGLGGRESLGENQGMLFIFAKPSVYSFWMKDMKISLDFIWILNDKIIDITENVPPPKNSLAPLPIYQPKEAADKVLEVNAGWVASHGIKTGDEVQIGN